MSTSFFGWNSSYELGIASIDEQHKKLVAILNDLYVAFMEKKINEQAEPVLQQLKEYTHYHFNAEEKIFARYGYSDSKKHIKEHTDFIAGIAELENDFKLGKPGIPYKMVNFLRSWLSSHIMQSDKEYATYFKTKGIEIG